MLQVQPQLPFEENDKKGLFIDSDYEPDDETKTSSVQSPMYSRSASSFYERFPQLNKPKPKKTVSFHHTAFVVLIPTVQEYHDAGLGDLLWWNDNDFHAFKLSAAGEIKEFMKLHPDLDAKSAMKLYFKQFNKPDDQINAQQNGESQQQKQQQQQEEFLMDEDHPQEQQEPRQQQSEPIQVQQDEEEEEEAAEQENIVPVMMTQRQDSISLGHRHLPFLPHHIPTPQPNLLQTEYSSPPIEQFQSAKMEYEPLKYTPPLPPTAPVTPYSPNSPNSPHSRTSSSCSTSSSNESRENDPVGVSLDSVGVLARMMALGLLVFMNRN